MQITLDIDLSNIKRLYLKNGVVKTKCLTCAKELTLELADKNKNNNLYCPKVGEKESLSIYCDTCDVYYEIPMVINKAVIELELDIDGIKEELF